MRSGEEYAILKGITVRIVANSPISDLEIIEKPQIKDNIRNFEEKLDNNIRYCINDNCEEKVKKKLLSYERGINKVINGKVLHLDGDKSYAEKSYKYYRSLGINAVVKNISESKQPLYIRNLLIKYKPDILVITGHDALIKSGTNYYNISNYRNSKYFVQSVKEARKVKPLQNDLFIFAGACQSFYEALMEAGANFASSPRKNFDRFFRSVNSFSKNCYNR